MTTAIGADRPSDIAFQKYPDAVFLRDGTKLYLGDGGDAALSWDNTNSLVTLSGTWSVQGADLHLSDTQLLQFGNGADTTITHDGTSTKMTGSLFVQGGDITMSDTASLLFGNTAGDASVTFDATNLQVACDSDIVLTAAGLTVTTERTLGVAGRTTESGAVYFKSDTAGGGFFMMVSSG